jgi:hypothetical protein
LEKKSLRATGPVFFVAPPIEEKTFMDSNRSADPSDKPDFLEPSEQVDDEVDASGDEFEAMPDDGDTFAAEGQRESDAADADLQLVDATIGPAGPEGADWQSLVSTLPLDGNLPADTDSLHRALRRWEAVAADFADDPHFVRNLTGKPRDELAMIDRGPLVPVVFLERETMTPVVYKPQVDSTSPWHVPPIPEDGAGEADHGAGPAPPMLFVTLDRAPEHYQKAFEAQGEKWLDLMEAIVERGISGYARHQAALDRAIFGQF